MLQKFFHPNILCVHMVMLALLLHHRSPSKVAKPTKALHLAFLPSCLHEQLANCQLSPKANNLCDEALCWQCFFFHLIAFAMIDGLTYMISSVVCTACRYYICHMLTLTLTLGLLKINVHMSELCLLYAEDIHGSWTSVDGSVLLQCSV